MRTAAGWPLRRLWILLFCALTVGCGGVSVWRVRSAPRDRAATGHHGPAMAGGDRRIDAAWANHALALLAGKTSTDVAARLELDAIAGVEEALAWPSAPVEVGAARDLYNEALEGLLRSTGGRRIRPDQRWHARLAGMGILVAGPGPDSGPLWPADRFDDLLFADDFSVQGMEPIHRIEGFGVPMIAVRRFHPMESKQRTGQDRFLTPREVYPVTAILRPVTSNGGAAAGARAYRLELRDPLALTWVALAGRPRPMAADITTPLAYHLARSPLPILQEVGLLDPGWLQDLEGLYMLHPYRPGKIPLVLVHGLRSSPLAWLKVIDAIWADPVLRERYQVWLFIYPTGLPFPSSAARLRADLFELRNVIDPSRADPMLDRMVLVGHSMGGLISKMMILESGDAVWRLFSNHPFEELQVPPERREKLRRTLFFSPIPSIARVVFIATPHRGSRMGDQLIGRVTSRLIRLPRTLRSAYREVLRINGRAFFTPMLSDGIPTSIEELRFDNPLLVTLGHLPRRQGVPVHSIIGRKDPLTPVETSSDGVVPYESSHIDWAESEVVVTGGHMCQDLPDTIREIRRILLLHLEAAPPFQ